MGVGKRYWFQPFWKRATADFGPEAMWREFAHQRRFVGEGARNYIIDAARLDDPTCLFHRSGEGENFVLHRRLIAMMTAGEQAMMRLRQDGRRKIQRCQQIGGG